VVIGPLVSVIIPVYNGEKFLADAVTSVQRQAYAPVEIIIVDDGSTDSTREIAAQLTGNIRYVYQDNSGPPAARNTAVKLAQGEFVTFLDSDDLWVERRLEIQVAMLLEHPTYDLVMGNLQLVKMATDSMVQPALIGKPFPALSLGTTLIRRFVFERVGFLDEQLRYDDDVDWLLRVKQLGMRLVLHEDTVLLYRRHASNLTNDMKTNYKYLIQALHRSLTRQRRKDG
jgi:glycosyltransferase involved in cell wall biosynthesis